MKYLWIIPLGLFVTLGLLVLVATIFEWVHQPMEQWVDFTCKECGKKGKRRTHWPMLCGTCSSKGFFK